MKIDRDPLVGILTAGKADGTVAVNGRLFRNLQQKLISLGGISFVFTLDGVYEHTMKGFIYLPDENRWRKGEFPYPDIVYNRIPFRKSEQTKECRDFFSRLTKKGIPFFNPCFIDKYELYCLLKDHPVLGDFLPKTILVTQKKELALFIDTYPAIYLKPVHSSKGKGIFRLRRCLEQIQLEGIKSSETFSSFEDFWACWGTRLLEKNYLAQEGIDPAEVDGNRYDFRILAHGDGDEYTITGIGIRQSVRQDITTHIPTGGRLLPYERLRTSLHDQFIYTIVPHIGKTLSKQFGYFGEFSIDAGLSKAGHYYIYEVNSKPMSFDETEIEMRRIDRLCRLFGSLLS